MANFKNIKSFPIYQTTSTEVSTQFVIINNKHYVGLHRKFNPTTDHSQRQQQQQQQPESKGVYLPLTAWNKFVKSIIPLVDKEIQKHNEETKTSSSATVRPTTTTTTTKQTKNPLNAKKGIILRYI